MPKKPSPKAKTKAKSKAKHRPKEDFNQATFRVMQEVIKKSEL
jgi:hypothetical protein